MAVTEVELAREVEKALISKKRLPREVVTRFRAWVLEVETKGITSAQSTLTWKDHALKGEWAGCRAIRLLGRQWRAIYRISENGDVTLVTVERISPHDYKK